MSKTTPSVDRDQPFIDPDQLKMPEASGHRQAVDLIGLAITRLLDPGSRVFRNMNWYPASGDEPMAPDLMVLPAEVTEARPTSYRQDQTDGPSPSVVVEIPSDNDGFIAFRQNVFGYQRWQTVAVIVVIDGARAVLKLGPRDTEPLPWTDHPIPELGGLRLGFDDGDLVATLPDGVRATSDGDLLAQLDQRVGEARRLADEAEARAYVLRRQLEALGIRPDEPAPDRLA